MEFNPIDFIQHILNIIVLYVLLRTLLYNPIRKFMKERESKQAAKQSQIENALKEANDAKEASKHRLEEIEITVHNFAEEKREYAQKEADRMIEEARAISAHIIEEANSRVISDKQKASEDMIEQTAIVAVELAKKILEREISVEDNKKLIEDFFNKAV